MNLDATVVLNLPAFPADDRAAQDAVTGHILGLVRRGMQVIVVCEADRDQIDEANRRASSLTPLAGVADRATLLNAPATERTTDLADALRESGIATSTVTAYPLARGAAVSAEPRRLPARSLAKAFETANVVVLPGGVGVDELDGTPVNLGEDGAALTGVFVAGRLTTPLVVARFADGPVGRLPRRANLLARRLGVTPTDAVIDVPASTPRVIGDGVLAEWLRASYAIDESAVTDVDVIVDAGGAESVRDLPAVVLSPSVAASLVAKGSKRTNVDVSPAATGAIPALEAIRSLATEDEIVYVRLSASPGAAAAFDAAAVGADSDDAILSATDAGLSPWSAQDELSGAIAAQRLAVLASEAFGEAVDWRSIPTRGVEAVGTREIEKTWAAGRRFRLVATAERREIAGGAREIRTRVGPVPVKANSALATRGGFGAVEIGLASGAVVTLRGGISGWEALRVVARRAAEELQRSADRLPTVEVTTRPSVAPAEGARSGPLGLIA